MKHDENTLVATDTYTTLMHIRCLIIFLQDFYCLSDIPGKRPPKELHEEVYTGIYFVMQLINQALASEMARIKQQEKQTKADSSKGSKPQSA